MQVIKNYPDIKLKSKYLKTEDNICFVDIETLGLSRDHHPIYLIGILYFEDNKWTLEQVWINSLDKEKELLVYSIRLINSFKYIINYNGNSFDIPYINHRAKIYELASKVDNFRSFDIYSILRSNKTSLNLPNLKLETVEEYLGIYREDIYSGLECIYLYKNFLKTGNLDLKDKVLQHNFDDLIYLAEILKVIDSIFEKKSIEFKYRNNNNLFIINEILNIKNTLKIRGFILNNNINKAAYFMSDYKLIIDEYDKFEINIQLYKGLLGEDEKAKFVYKTDFQLKQSASFNNYNFKIPSSIIMLDINGLLLEDNIYMLIYLVLNLTIKKSR